ncbi:MAG: hypothetical protein ACKO7Z_05720 [Cyanobacteriota bacterium]
MARYTTTLQIPWQPRGSDASELSAALAQALLLLDLELVHTTRLQVAAAASAGGRWPSSLRLLLSWRQPAPPAQSVELTLELLSRESMVTGAPISRAALEQLVAGLMGQLPGLQYRGGALVS